VTYLFEGEIVHRDSLGCEQVIRPGELNWMTAGRGIVHSERTGPSQRRVSSFVHGIQSWVALPLEDEECEPGFEHYGEDAMPRFTLGQVELRLLAGSAFGRTSPVHTRSSLFYVEADCAAGASLALDVGLGQRGVYVVSGRVAVGGEHFGAGRMLVLADQVHIDVHALEPSKLMLLGGVPLLGERHIWWNFVSSSPARIEQAKADWQARRFAAVPGDDGYMPLPG
jgi:redox-sensitive bicupin YhaK (pirin superfamily)